MLTIGEWLNKAQSRLASSPAFNDDAHLTLKFLLEARLKRNAAFSSTEMLEPKEECQLNLDLEELFSGKPLPYVIREWSFYGDEFFITPDVLIPRPETELLVEEALTWLTASTYRNPVVYDVGTGSGIIAIEIAKRFQHAKVIASDISPEALQVCLKNIEKHDLSHRITTLLADGLPELNDEIHLLCANLPYISEDAVNELRVTEFEPRLALDGGPDGLRIIEKVLADSVHRMQQKSLLLFEIEAGQKTSSISLAVNFYPNSTITVLKDLAGKDRLLRIENE